MTRTLWIFGSFFVTAFTLGCGSTDTGDSTTGTGTGGTTDTTSTSTGATGTGGASSASSLNDGYKQAKWGGGGHCHVR
jgi:hypothetical protein